MPKLHVYLNDIDYIKGVFYGVKGGRRTKVCGGCILGGEMGKAAKDCVQHSEADSTEVSVQQGLLCHRFLFSFVCWL